MQQGAIVRWSERALVRRDEHDRLYARRSVGLVLAIVNGGWAARVLWPFGERVNGIEDLEEL